MVAVAQLVEPRIVVAVVVGSSPIGYPNQFRDVAQSGLGTRFGSEGSQVRILPSRQNEETVIYAYDWSWHLAYS